MKIVRFQVADIIRHGILDEDEIRALESAPFSSLKTTGAVFRLDHVQLKAPVLPTKIIGIGMNYTDHIREMGHPTPEEPLICLKAPSALNGPGEPIALPALSKKVEYEGELALVIGTRCHKVPEETALQCILGYSCFNDITARDLQLRDVQFTRAKSFDTFACIGPHLETVLDTADLKLQTRVNGEIRQDSSTSHLLFKVPYLVSFVSQVMTLMPGDIITTGTPSGVGPLKSGDRFAVTISGIGTLENSVE